HNKQGVMKSIQHPENHPVFMAIPPQPHHKTLSLTVIIFSSLCSASRDISGFSAFSRAEI
ncbi:hypothetical protein ACWTVP_21175, partial [Escherichia coli]|uniref:hypothetical protein n=1 Tax=Escherichia coli TaxID=562 RepID=UPI00195526EE